MEDTCYMFCSYEYMEDNNLCYVALNLKSKLRKIDIWNEILCATAAHFAYCYFLHLETQENSFRLRKS